MTNLGKIILGAGMLLTTLAPMKKGFSQIDYKYLKANISRDVANEEKLMRIWDCISADVELQSKKIYTNFKAANNLFTLNDYANLSLGPRVIKDKHIDVSPQMAIVLDPRLVVMPDHIKGSPTEYGGFSFNPELSTGIKARYNLGKFSGNFEADFHIKDIFAPPIFYTQHRFKADNIGVFELFAKGRNIEEGYAELTWTSKPIKDVISLFAKYSIKGINKELKVKNRMNVEFGISFGMEKIGREIEEDYAPYF